MATVSDMQLSTPVALRARVVVWSALLLRCTIRDREVDLSPHVVLPGTTVRRSGDDGIVVLPKWYARNLDLA